MRGRELETAFTLKGFWHLYLFAFCFCAVSVLSYMEETLRA